VHQMSKTDPFPFNFSHHSAVVSRASTLSIRPTISSLFSTLKVLVVNRPSDSQLGVSKTSGPHSVRNCVSLPAESIRKESLVGKTW
jgi:hypothetical protein